MCYGMGMKLIAIATLALLLGGACGRKEPQEAPTGGAATPAAPGAPVIDEGRVAAKEIFATRCAMCHGPSGRGDGAAATALSVKPRNYTDKAWQASVTDEELRKIILLGGQAVGKSPMMPGQSDLQDKPAVVDALVAMIREFGK